MSADDAFAAMTHDVLAEFADAEQMTYRGDSGDITVTGYVFMQDDYLGDEVQVGEDRWRAALQVSEVGNPRRGDQVIDRNSVEWVLQKRIGADEWMETWAVTKR